jgi:hypothetical protein
MSMEGATLSNQFTPLPQKPTITQHIPCICSWLLLPSVIVSIEGTTPGHLKRLKGPPALLLLPPLLLHVSLTEDYVIPFRDLALLRV